VAVTEPREPLRAVRDDETAASILPGAARVGELDALLREVDGLRLTLETDLTLVAAAVEAGNSAIAVDVVDSSRESLRGFESKALGHLTELASTPKASRWAKLSAAPFAAAAAIVALLIGVVPNTLDRSGDLSPTAVSAQSSLAKLETLAAQGQTNQVRSTARTLHDQINALVADSEDPQAAHHALLLLSYEQLAIVQSGDEAKLRDVLADAHAIATRIRSQLPRELRTVVPRPPAVVVPPPAKPTTQPAPKRSVRPRSTSPASPAATTQPAPSAKPTPSPKPTPTATASPSPSPTAGKEGASSPYPVPLG
jgi:hypothetical protein